MKRTASAFGERSLWLGVHDALSARIASEAPIAAVWLSSYGVSAARKACPDASFLTGTEMMDTAREVSRAAGAMPVVVDCDTGYGDAAVFAHLVAEYAQTTNVAALSVEDRVFPKRNSMYEGGPDQLDSVDVFEEKLRAGVTARNRTRPSLQLIARTEALVLQAGVDEAVARLIRYAAAGADALLVQAKGPIVDLIDVAKRLRSRVKPPLICVPTAYPGVAAEAWWKEGFSVVVRSHQLLQASVQAQQQALPALVAADRTVDDLDGQLAAHGEINRLVEVSRLGA